MGSRSHRHVRSPSNQPSSSRSRDLDTDPPLSSPPPYSYYDQNYHAEQADTQYRQQEDRDRRRRHPEMVESQSFLRAQQDQMSRWEADMRRQRRDRSIAEGIGAGEHRFPERRPLPGANSNQERFNRYSYASYEGGPSNRSTTYNQGGIDTGEHRFPERRPLPGANSNQERFNQYSYAPYEGGPSNRSTTYNQGGIDTGEKRSPHTRPLERPNNDREDSTQYPRYEAGPSSRTRHDSGSFPHVDDVTQIEEIDNTTYAQPAPAAANLSSNQTLPEVRIVPDNPSSPFREIQGEDQYSREKRYHIWRWARRVKKVREGRAHNKWYKHARVFQHSFEKKTKDCRAKQEIMPWITHLGRAPDDFGRGL